MILIKEKINGTNLVSAEMNMNEVVQVSFKRHDLVKMVEELLDVVYKHAGKVSLAEAIGSLELCKAHLLTGKVLAALQEL